MKCSIPFESHLTPKQRTWKYFQNLTIGKQAKDFAEHLFLKKYHKKYENYDSFFFSNPWVSFFIFFFEKN